MPHTLKETHFITEAFIIQKWILMVQNNTEEIVFCYIKKRQNYNSTQQITTKFPSYRAMSLNKDVELTNLIINICKT